MRVALLTNFAAGKKEPLAAVLERIHAAFAAAGQDEPTVRFILADAPVPGHVSSIDRVLKRYPELQRFLSSANPVPGGAPVRHLSNGPASHAAGESVAFATLLAIAAGVPRSFPFHSIVIRLHTPAFGDEEPSTPIAGMMFPGVIVSDSWWINGRNRSLSALTIVDADPTARTLPPVPDAVQAVFASCGKVKNTVQVPLADSGGPPRTLRSAGRDSDMAKAVAAVVLDYRSRLTEVLERAAMPHDLPPALEALRTTPLGEKTGPKKPVLARAFKPLGYECHSGSGTFTLRRRTPGHLTVEIELDVGTWSRSLTAGFEVQGVGFAARLPLPVSPRAIGGGQYPIGNTDRWQQIVDNLAALVAELDRSFVPAVEKAAGAGPEWYKPES